MHKGIRVRGIHSSEDMGLCIAAKAVTAPVRKEALVSVPFAHGSYDFSAIGGEVYYNNRELSCSFDVIGDGTEDAERRVASVVRWLAPVCNEPICDDDRPGLHWIGSCSKITTAWDESGLAATVEAVLSVHPFAMADTPSRACIAPGQNPIANHGDSMARLTVVPDGTVTIKVGQLRQTFNGRTASSLYLAPGRNSVEVSGGSALVLWEEGYL